MKVKINKLQNAIFFLIIIIVSLFVYKVDGIYFTPKVLISNFLIIIISLTFLVYGDRYNYSLNKMFMTFSFFFFGIAPALQYQYGVTMWQGKSFSDTTYFKMNILIIIILLTYQGLYYLFSKLSTNNFIKKNYKKSLNKYILLLITLISMLITLYYNKFNLTNLLFRAGDEIGRVSTNQSISLIYSNFIKPIPAISLILLKINNIKDKKLEIMLFAILLLTNFPTSGARFYVASIYIPLIIIYFKKINKKYLLFNKIFIVLLLIIFPILDQVRRINNFSDFSIGFDFKMFLGGHFDSFQMFMRVIDENFITKGKQLITAILFFVPRSVWPNKSVGSGYLLSSELSLSFNNISMNYFGEGYINFGYYGIIIFIFILAFVNAKLDKIYWYNLINYNYMSPYYLFLLGLSFFILRGDLLSSFAFTLGILISAYFVNKIAT